MSTGADCQIYEKTPGEWFYKLQHWPYGETPEYSEYGPFNSEDSAILHLSDNHANPGGYCVTPYSEA